MARNEVRMGAALSITINFVICLFDFFCLLSPMVCIADNKNPTLGEILVVIMNVLARILLTLVFISRYPRHSLIFCTFPFLNVIASLTYGMRIYEFLEMGDNKEYDGYRYYRTWMYCFLVNVPFEIVSLILDIKGECGIMAVSIMVLTWNIIHIGRCFLAQWANVEKGNDLHSDFQATIQKHKL